MSRAARIEILPWSMESSMSLVSSFNSAFPRASHCVTSLGGTSSFMTSIGGTGSSMTLLGGIGSWSCHYTIHKKKDRAVIYITNSYVTSSYVVWHLKWKIIWNWRSECLNWYMDHSICILVHLIFDMNNTIFWKECWTRIHGYIDQYDLDPRWHCSIHSDPRAATLLDGLRSMVTSFGELGYLVTSFGELESLMTSLGGLGSSATYIDDALGSSVILLDGRFGWHGSSVTLLDALVSSVTFGGIGSSMASLNGLVFFCFSYLCFVVFVIVDL